MTRCSRRRSSNDDSAVETVPIFIKFHKTASTLVATLLGAVCTSTPWWMATPRNAIVSRKQALSSSSSSSSSSRAQFCNSDPFWHQTIHQYRSAHGGGCSLRNCVRGWSSGVRNTRLLAIFREPTAKFVSGLYFFARRERKRRLESVPPQNLSLPELDDLARASLEVRMKAPVQEYTVVLARHEEDFKWGTIADAVTVARAMRNLELDLEVVGSADRVAAFLVLAALELGWDSSGLPCAGTVNARRTKKGDMGKGTKSYSYAHFRPDQQKYIADMMTAETQVYQHALATAAAQELKHPMHPTLLASYNKRCEMTDDEDEDGGNKKRHDYRSSEPRQMRISSMKAARKGGGQLGAQERAGAAIACSCPSVVLSSARCAASRNGTDMSTV